MLHQKTTGRKLETLLKNLCTQYNADILVADKNGGFRLPYDNDQWLTCFEDIHGQAIVSAPIEGLPENGREKENIIQKMLTHNLTAIKQQQEVLSLCDESAQMILYRRFDLQTTPSEKFEHIIENFINRLEALQRKIHTNRCDNTKNLVADESKEAVLAFRRV